MLHRKVLSRSFTKMVTEQLVRFRESLCLVFVSCNDGGRLRVCLRICLVPDSGHFCISGYNEVLMLRRLPERHKLHACQMVPGFEKYNPLYDVPHGFEQECPPNWFDVETIEKWRKLG
jgi:hypothetical protein